MVRNYKHIKGVFIHISFIDEKPKPLGTELNNLECSDTDIILLLEIKRVKKFIFHLENTDFNPKNACSIDIFQPYVSSGHYLYLHPSTLTSFDDNTNIFQVDIYFESVSIVNNIYHMGHKLKFTVKTLYINFLKENLEDKIKPPFYSASFNLLI